MILITTIWHTGTHSLMAELGVKGDRRGKDWEQWHCTPETLNRIAKGDYEIHTTLRDPVEVAISWANREKLSEREITGESAWHRQWRIWRDICKTAIIHDVRDFSHREGTYHDKLGLYKELERGNWTKIFEHIPRDMVEFAEDLTREVHGVKFGVPYT